MITSADIRRILTARQHIEPSDDFRIIDSWTEYSGSGAKPVAEQTVEYMCFELEMADPVTGEKSHIFKAIQFCRVRRLPKSAKESRSLMDMHTQVLTAVWENEINFVTVIANIIEPVPIGLLFLYGVQGVGNDIEEAKENAHKDFLGFIGTIQGTYRVLELSMLTSEEGEWLLEKMYGMKYITAVRGIPKSHNEGVDISKGKGNSGSLANPDGQATLEELIVGMVDYEYIIEVISTPVYTDTLKAWSLRTEKDMTDWYGQLQGTKGYSFNLSIPMMYMANQSTSSGWSQAYTDAESVSYNEGTSYSTSYGENTGTSLSETFGSSIGHTEGVSSGESVSFSHSVTEGDTVGHTTGETVGHTEGVTVGDTIGHSVSYNEGITEGETHGITHGTTDGVTTGITDGTTVGTTTGHTVGHSEGNSYTHTVGNSYGESFGTSHTVGETFGTSHSDSQNYGTSQSSSENWGDSHSDSVNNGTSTNHSYSDSSNWSNSYGETSSHGTSHSTSASNSQSESYGTSQSEGYSESVSSSHSNSNSYGQSFGRSESTSQGNSSGLTSGHTTGTTSGSSYSHSTGTSQSSTSGTTTGHSTSSSHSTGESSSSNYGTSHSDSHSDSSGTSNSNGWSHSDSNSNTHSDTSSNSGGYSTGRSTTSGSTYGTSSSDTGGSSYTGSQSSSNSDSSSQSTSHSDSTSTNDSTSSGGSMGANAYGFNIGGSHSSSHGDGSGASDGTGSSSSSTSGTGDSTSVGYSDSHTQGSSDGESTSTSVTGSRTQSYSEGSSDGWSRGTSDGTSGSTSSSHSTSTGSSDGYSIGTSSGRSSSDTTGSSDSYSSSNSRTSGTSSSFSQGQSYSTSDSSSISNSRGASSSRGETTSSSTTLSQGTSDSTSHGSTASSTEGTSHSTSNSIGYGVTNGTSESVSESLSHSQGGGASVSDGYGTSHSTGYTDGTSHSTGVSSGTSQSYGSSDGTSYSQSISDGTSHTVSTTQSVSDGTTHSFTDSYSDSVSQSQSRSHSDSLSNSHSQSLSYSDSQSLSNSRSHGTSDSTSHSVSNSSSESFSRSQSDSVSHSSSVSEGTTNGRSTGTSSSDSTSESHSTGKTDTKGASKSVSNGTSSGTSRGRNTGESIGSSGGYSSGTSSSMGLGPSIGYSKSYQWVDQQVKDILELLEFQNQRLKKALRGEGAMYTYVYVACPNPDALATAMTTAKSTWQNEYAMIQPLQVLDLNENEQDHLLYRFSAFSADVTREIVAGAEEYKYATVLLPGELTALTHLPRISEGGIYANVDDIPKYAVPSMMKGEIYMGTILSAERYSFNNGYSTPFDYRLNEAELMHGIFAGASRSGKTVAAIRFAAELSKVRRKKTGKRLRIVCMDPKTDWRVLARYVEPERFKYYSLGNINFRPINLNPWKIPKNIWPQIWIDGIIDIYCRAYGLLERGKQMIGETVYSLYEDAGVFRACDKENWREIVPDLSKRVTFDKIFDRMTKLKAALEDPGNPKGKAGNDTRDAYARLLDRLQPFSRDFSIERRLFSNEDGLSVDELIGDDDVTVLESSGLESTFSNFVFGVITSGFYKVAKSYEAGFLDKSQFETVLFIEEANKVLTGNDNATSGGGGNIGLPGQSEFEEILDQAAGYGLFVFAITQKVADMPSSVIANSGMMFAGRQVRPDDTAIVIRKIAREERYEDRDMTKWFPRAPIGWLVCQSARGYDYKSAEPVLVKIARLNDKSPNNEELDSILTYKAARKIVKKIS